MISLAFCSYLLLLSFGSVQAGFSLESISSALSSGSQQVSATSTINNFLTPASPLTNPGTAILQSMAQTQLTKVGMGLGDVQSAADILPIFNFFKNLSSNFVAQQNGWDYNSAQISIQNSNVDSKTGSTTSVTKLQCDLQFKGGGDINSPIGYLIQNGKYYFTPGQNLFLVQNNNNGTTQVRDLLSGSFRTSILNFMKLASATSLKSAVNTIKTFFDRAPYLYPQDIFVIKMLQLINTATKNSKSGTSYPRIAHIPLESMVLIKRLSITPNYTLTMSNHSPAPQYAYQWDPNKIVFFQSPLEAIQSSLINVNPSFLTSVLGSVQVTVSQDDWENYQSITQPTTSSINLQKAVSLVWTTTGYNNRSNFILNNFLPNANFVAYSQSEQKLFVNTILYHISQRNSGFLLYSQIYQEMLGNSSATPTQISSAISKNVLSGLAGANLDIGIILAIFSGRMGLVQKMITYLLDILSKASTNEFLTSAVQYLNAQLNAIDAEKSYYIDATNNIVDLKNKAASASLSSSDLMTAQSNLVAAIGTLAKQIATFETNCTPKLNDNVLINKNISLQDYLNLKFSELKQIDNTRFRGDAGYYNDPLPLEGSAATRRALAIMLRTESDLQKASDLFQKDLKTYSMYDTNGSQIDVRGPDMYAQTVAVQQKLSTAVQKKLYDQKQSVISAGTQIIDNKLIAAATEVDNMAQTLQKRWLNFCLQYPFARVKTDPTLTQLQAQIGFSDILQKISSVTSLDSSSPIGKTLASTSDPANINLATAISATYDSVAGNQDTVSFADAGKVAQKYNFFGPTAAAQISALVTQNYLSSLAKAISDSNFAKFITNAVTTAQTSLDNIKQATDALQTSINTTQNIINSNSQASSISDPNLAGVEAQLAQLQTEQTNLQANLTQATNKLAQANQQQSNISFLSTWISSSTNQLSNASTLNNAVLYQALKSATATPASIAAQTISSAGLSSDIFYAAEQLAADITDSTNLGFANVKTIFTFSNNTATATSQNTSSATQVNNLRNSINNDISKALSLGSLINNLDTLASLTSSVQLSTVLGLPQGIASSSADIIKALNPPAATASTTTTPTTSSVTSLAPVVAGTGIPPQFGTYDPAYPKTILRFLAEEFCDLTTRSQTFKQYGSAIVDTMLIALFGYNLNTLLTVMQTNQLQNMQTEISELASYSTNNTTALIPQSLIDAIKSNATASEIKATDSNLSTLPATVITQLSSGAIGSASATTPILNINSTAGQAIDNLSGLNVAVNTNVTTAGSQSELDNLVAAMPTMETAPTSATSSSSDTATPEDTTTNTEADTTTDTTADATDTTDTTDTTADNNTTEESNNNSTDSSGEVSAAEALSTISQ